MEKERRRGVRLVLLFLLLLLVLLLGVLLGTQIFQKDAGAGSGGISLSVDPDAADWNADLPGGDPGTSVEGIAIPGYGKFTFAAGRLEQRVNLGNPRDNPCYFRCSIVLEGGEVLYTSQLIPPGKGVREIRLNRPLEKGIYPRTILRYECFSLDDDHTPLNGAQVVVELTAQ